MGITISNIRIKNFRSIESIDVELGLTNLLIGQNNTGKSNFLRAINIALGAMTDVSEVDIFITHNERLEKTKGAIIDIMFRPVGTDGEFTSHFSDFWTGVFTERWITTSPDEAFVGVRTEIKFDITRGDYVVSRKSINQWNDSTDEAQVSRAQIFNEDMRQYLSSFYMDANRDIVQDLRNRKSFFGRVTSGHDMVDEKVKEIEEQLSNVNKMIVESIPSLQQTKDRIGTVGQTIGSVSSNVEIEPLARKISDLNRGMEIVMEDGGGASFPISQSGSGTRSWISFLTFSAFVEDQAKKMKEEDEEIEQYVMLTMEEPEAHLHPQAQRQLFTQMHKFLGQKIITTHSPSIATQSALADYIYISKKNGRTNAVHYKANDNCVVSDGKITREVLNTRAELLFSSVIILCEGITEELALPVYFNEYFGCSTYSHGVSITGIGGQNYKTYLSLVKDFEIPWFIFSDGEANAIKTIRAAVRDVFSQDYACLSNVVIIDNENNYEEHLIADGYCETIIEAICEHEANSNFFNSYVSENDGKLGKGGVVRNYSGETGKIEALMDLCRSRKAEYALPVARKIVLNDNIEKRIPRLISELFDEVAKILGVEENTQPEDAI